MNQVTQLAHCMNSCTAIIKGTKVQNLKGLKKTHSMVLFIALEAIPQINPVPDLVNCDKNKRYITKKIPDSSFFLSFPFFPFKWHTTLQNQKKERTKAIQFLIQLGNKLKAQNNRKSKTFLTSSILSVTKQRATYTVVF